MPTDYGEKERAFIDGLKENTGRDLGEWMQAIASSGQLQRNDIIDWLRHKGLMFSKASWLERIHHNGGKPIYADAPKESAPRRPPRRRREGVLAGAFATGGHHAPPPAPAAAPAAPASPPQPSGDLDALLAKAKAYRPLAQLVLAKIKSVRSAAQFSPRDGAVVIGDPGVFAALGISGKELRLHLALGEHPFDEVVKKGQAGGGLGKGEALSHMLVLTDARQVDQRFMDLIALAK
jgi:Domain of unknown function (DUF5655)